MARRQLNVRVAPLTRGQLLELKQRYGMSEGEIIALAIDRLYQSRLTVAAAERRCPRCGGKGVRPGPDGGLYDCDRCNGTGAIPLDA